MDKKNSDDIYSDDESTLYIENSPVDLQEYMDDEDTVMVNDDEPTLFFHSKTGENGTSLPYLLRKRNNKKVYITKDVFRIGREVGSVDYCIKDNHRISRTHVDIIIKNSIPYIVDLNSKNRTRLNDVLLAPNVETELHMGDSIRMANEDFVFGIDI